MAWRDEAARRLNATEELLEAACLLGAGVEAVEAAEEGAWCPAAWDMVLCWPRTRAGTTARLPCFEEFKGVKYDTSSPQNASRECHANGTWDSYSDYAACVGEPQVSPSHLDTGVEVTSTMYFVGYALSLVALCIAIWIFLYFKDLRCLRNTIHTNLMVTYVLADFLWILNITLQTSTSSDSSSCVVLTILLHFFLLTTYFWMFVEGLYLYMLVVETFSAESIKFRVYVVIGWGAPLLIVVTWSVAKSLTPIATQQEVFGVDLGFVDGSEGFVGDTAWTETLLESSEYLQHCLSSPWMVPHSYDWIFKAPIIFVLAVNFVFLVMIMWVLITKLRSANTAETQQYRKATKALLVLIPLLGIAYILMIAGPTEGVTGHIFSYLRAITISTQGFTVALFYCFLNTEVQNTMRHHLDQWRTARSFHGSRRYTYSKDWSPRSRTESIRLFAQPSSHGRKRESTVSEMTTTTLVGGGLNNGRCGSSGGGGGGGGAGGGTAENAV
ncbi:diuretic hormone receptor-like isoform X2 [Bacillus rossius redtenbacheri]|uniref:diuretic hormone receptor-like isoform X2 n=1 Tax=Bacillus rossius redtenbacheri TaxID=93214 RepID=UPI002FDD10EA